MSYGKMDFVQASKVAHGARYSYKKSVYVNAHTKVVISCKLHGEFEQTPMAHTKGQGCPICAQLSRNKTRTLSTEEFIKRARKVHGNVFDYRTTKYVSSSKNIEITCKKHGVFLQRPNNHLTGQGCPKCCYIGRRNRRLKDLSHFIRRAQKVHGDTYDYSKSEYVGAKLPVKIRCRTHGVFEQIANNHTKGQGCPKCQAHSYSMLAIKWIEQEAKRRNLRGVEHAQNAGEYRIPGTRLKVDGYHAQSKTIFEFYGDCWHGNPKRHKPREHPHPFCPKLTAHQLYMKTLEREYMLKALGYKVITIWESDYRNK